MAPAPAPMQPEEFTDRAAVRNIVDRLKADLQDTAVSDLVDAHGHQYIDLVMEGGGVLGVALVGYAYVLEQCGIRFLGIGGTSAGSINALLLAGVGEPAEAKAVRLLELLAALDMGSFVDGDDDARDLIRTALAGAGKARLGFKLLQCLDNLNDDHGLNPGRVFYDWVAGALAQAGIRTTDELVARMNAVPPGLSRRDGDLRPGDAEASLALVAAEITTETKVDFPRMAPLFWDRPGDVPPAEFVRASMSIPFFFHPHRVGPIPQGREAWNRWRELASYHGDLPETCVFVDGGIVSNFPIDLFHDAARVPICPTFGVKLGADRQVRAVDDVGSLTGAIFDAARHCLDYDFIARNPDYRHLVATIDTGPHHWLDFELTNEAKFDLFLRGAQAADTFLRTFDWERYKDLRASLIPAHRMLQERRVAEHELLPPGAPGERVEYIGPVPPTHVVDIP